MIYRPFAERVVCAVAPKAFGTHCSEMVNERKFKEQNAERPTPNRTLFTRCGGATVVGDQPFAYAISPTFLPFAAAAAAAVGSAELPRLLPAFADSCHARGHQAPEWD